MPKINKVSGNVLKIEENPVKTDLIESKQETPTTISVKLPDFLAPTTEMMPELAENTAPAYVGFADNRAKLWPTLQQAGCEVGDIYLYIDGSIFPKKPLEYFFLMGESFVSKMVGAEMSLMFASKNINTQYEDKQIVPHYVSLLLVKHEGTLVPIRGDFRGTKSGAVEKAVRAVQASTAPEWARRSDAHKIAASFPQPFGRVLNIATTRPYIVKSGPNAGNKAFIADSQNRPTTASEIEMLLQCFQNEEWKKRLEVVHDSYRSRVDFMMEQCDKYAKI